MVRAADTADGVASLGRLLVAPGVDGAVDTTERAQRRVLDHRAIGGSAGEFLVPVGARRAALGPLLAYRRLRPWRPRLGRLAVAGALGAGFGALLGPRRRLVAAPDEDLLIDRLAEALGEPGLLFAGTARPCREFVTPVLQLLRPDGRTVGFAKLGWDVVTDSMVVNERDALDRVARVGVPGLRVPAVRWAGTWNGHAVLVTAPLPSGMARLRDDAPIPTAPLRALAELDGPLRRSTLAGSAHWAAARAAALGDPVLEARLEHIERTWGEVELDLGRWHGDWVGWNLGSDRDVLHAWDWAYSAPEVPFGFDAIHFAYLPRQVLGGLDPDRASEAAAPAAAAALAALGIPEESRAALLALHRLEVDLRELRARALRASVAPRGPRP